MSNLIGNSIEAQVINLWKHTWYKYMRRIVFLDYHFSKKLRYDTSKESWVIGTFYQLTLLNFHFVLQHDERISDHDPRIGDTPKGGLL